MSNTQKRHSIESTEQAFSAGRRVLDSLDFAVPRGSVVGLLGTNGAGKTHAAQMARWAWSNPTRALR